MLIWGAVWGALLGLLWPGWDGEGIMLGALLGLAAGWSLRRAVRREIARQIDALGASAPARAPNDDAPQAARAWHDDAAVAPAPATVPMPASARAAVQPNARAGAQAHEPDEAEFGPDSFFPDTVPGGDSAAQTTPRPPAPPSALDHDLT